MKAILRSLCSRILVGVTIVLSLSAAAQNSSKSLLINHGGTACGNDSPEDNFFAGTLTSSPTMVAGFQLGIPYYNTFTAYNPADHKVYFATLGSSTTVYAMDFNFSGALIQPPATPAYVYGYELNQLCFDNNGNNYGFAGFDAAAGTAHLMQVDITTGNAIAGTDKLVVFPPGHVPNNVYTGDIVILPNGRMFASFGSAPSVLYEFTNVNGTGNVQAVFLTNIPRPCFSIAFIDGNLVVAGSDGGGCYYYIWDINSFALSNAYGFPLGKNSADMSNLTLAIGSSKALTGVNIIDATTARLYYQIVVKNKGNVFLNHIQVTDNLAQVFGAANVSNIHTGFSSNPANLQLNPAFDGVTDKNLLAANQQLANYPATLDSAVIDLEVTVTNLSTSNIYYNSAIASGDLGAGNNYMAVSDSSNNGGAARMDLDGNDVSDDAGENVPTPFIFSSTTLAASELSLGGAKTSVGVKLEWKDPSVEPTATYEVQRSADGVHFQTIGTLPAQKGPRYTFTDDVSGLTSLGVFYRIKANRLSGPAVLSNNLFIKNSSTPFGSLTAYPNPFTQSVNLQLQSAEKTTAQFFVKDITGRAIISKTLQIEKGANLLSVAEAEKLRPGLYILEVVSANERTAVKLLKR